MVNSTFAYYPGIPIFHSTDLVNWEQIGSVINRPSQLNLDSQGVSRGLFAPAIRYHNGTFYVTCTLVDNGGNFIVTTKNPAGEWSNPVWLPAVSGIDPSLFFDDNKIYLVYNSDALGNKPLYEGHRTIRLRELNDSLQPIGEEKILVNGGTDLSQKPVWIEGPHIYKINGWYYLMCAQGGTSVNHSEVIFRSKRVDGDFVPNQNNPILTQTDLDSNRENPITCTGHADLVETPEGKWYAVFLGCRPYEGNYFNTGRETFMTPVEWKDGFPVINPKGKAIQYFYPTPNNVALKPKPNEAFSGNYLFRDDFTNTTLNNRYLFLRNVREKWYEVGSGKLTIKLRPETCSGMGNPSFIGFRQAHIKNKASVELHFTPNTENEQAGLLIFYNETHYYFFCKTLRNGKPAIELLKSSAVQGEPPQELAYVYLEKDKKDESVTLMVSCKGSKYDFSYSDSSPDSAAVVDTHFFREVDAKFLSTQIAGGFVGCLYAMYATSNDVKSNNTASFSVFNYAGYDETFGMSYEK
jgi:alpha-N-arabinofuranosidase